MIPVKFGTSGHRGIIHDSFTLKHVQAIGQAVATLLNLEKSEPTVIVGYDPRTGNDPDRSEGSFTGLLVDTLIDQGVTVYFSLEPVPTPVISWAIEAKRLDGGLILTASHNPPEYNGLKFNPKNGAPAPVETTTKIETLANQYMETPLAPIEAKGTIILYDYKEEYARHLIDLVEDITGYSLYGSGCSLVVDTKYGACAEQWRTLFGLIDCEKASILHDQPDANFGGIVPNPTDISGLSDLKKVQLDVEASLAFANDPDGDRHVVLDETGAFVSPEELTCIVMNFLASSEVPVYGVGTTLASSRIVKDTAAFLAYDIHETEVGFKYFAPILEAARNEDMLALCVESSGGFSLSTHTLEKCGFLPGLLVLAICEISKLSLSELKAASLSQIRTSVFSETSLTFEATKRDGIGAFFSSYERESKGFSVGISTLDKRDGLKVILDSGAWVLMRLSGTEPLIRIYAEADSSEEVKLLLDEARVLLEAL